VSVISTLSTNPPMVADELRRQADQFIDLVDLQHSIGRTPSERPPRDNRRRPDAENEGEAFEASNLIET
ncbi:MAG: NYN domain-containing protein, partial [Methyloceanibacter sp.]